ncbi:MAG: cation:proton antiporter [Syntrophobacteraceae bacterium]|jgi:Kef-type K+ transport system membrane component KefB|nr:cation:proton antiporter [Syntrophobacteraceae bacterium]
MHEGDLLSNIGLAIVVATGFALLARAARQPLLLAYLAAGIVLGPRIGFGLIQDEANITLISEIGLILLLFIIGLEIDLKKLLSAGRTLIFSGVSQFLVCVALGIGFFTLLGFKLGGGSFDALYLAVAMALSSTMIVVKLLYDKFELTTLPGRITLGILVFQDIWAILFLALQPNLLTPAASVILLSLAKGAGLVVVSLALSKYVLSHVFSFTAKIPELLLVTAIAWCFLIAGIAGEVGLSKEMGALVAGVCLSTFPYNVDVIAKVINIRDFFVTLFFVGLGLQIPVPTVALLVYATLASLFLVATRFLSIFPVLYAMKNGLRASLIPSINLAQMSEFSLVIASLGLAFKHIDAQVVGILTFVFAITSVLSTYMIQYNHQIQAMMAPLAGKLGLRDIVGEPAAHEEVEEPKEVVFLGFFREASSIFHEIESMRDGDGTPLTERVLVIDFNPMVHSELNRRDVKCIYGDISSVDTLKHAHVDRARTVVCSIPDSILRGTTNERLLALSKRLCPEAQVIVTANTLQTALNLYRQGADFVFIPRIHSARLLARIISESLSEKLARYREEEMAQLMERREVLG